jgi:ATP-dependent RNA helicase RhlE
MYNKKRSFRGASPRRDVRRRPANKRSKQFIHESKFINRNVQAVIAEEAPLATQTFSDFALAAPLQHNLASSGFVTPSAIQEQTIPRVLHGDDVIGLANTGTGKTAAFLLPILTSLYASRRFESVLIMAPTRELAQQIDDEFRKFSQGMKLFSVLLVGGVNITPQLRGLARRPHVIIGTPGRIKDHIDRGSLKLHGIDWFVLDEADRMLDMGFVNDIRTIASLLPAKKQTLCFSATFNDGIKKIAQDFMRSPELISVKVTETNDHIYQDIVHYNDPDHKKELLINMLSNEEFEKVIVFGETKFGVQRLSDNIDKLGISSRAIHGNKSQSQRNRALADFKTNKARVLVATDVAARGLDIPNVSHVINFDTPQTYDDYVHRIGRTGRGGKTGKALTFIERKVSRGTSQPNTASLSPRVRSHSTSQQLTRHRPPSSKAAEARLTQLIDTM